MKTPSKTKPAKNEPIHEFDEVLKRMLSTPPEPHVKPKPQQKKKTGK